MKGDPSLDYCLGILYLIKQDIPKAEGAMDDLARFHGKNHPQYKQLKAIFEKQLKNKGVNK
jgi:hypothetical protein